VAAGVPSQAQYDDVMDWALEKDLIDKEVPYDRCINEEYLP
jgi:hypothetical protein